MKKMTNAIITKLEEKYGKENVTANGTTVSVYSYGKTFNITAMEKTYSVCERFNVHSCDTMKKVYAFIDGYSLKSEKVAETPKTISEETPAEETPVLFYKLDTRGLKLNPMKVNLRLSNVKNLFWFSRGICYSMYEKYLEKIEKIIDKLSSDLQELIPDSEEHELITLKKSETIKFKKKLMSLRDAMSFTEDEIESFREDRFMSLVSYAIFGGNLKLRRKYDVMTILENIANYRYSGKECNLKSLKDALNDIAFDFATSDDETGHYRNSRINVNATMTEQIWQTYYNGCQMKKSGNLSNKNFAKIAKIEQEISRQIVGKLQGSIDIED